MPYHRRRRVVEDHSKTIESNVTVKSSTGSPHMMIIIFLVASNDGGKGSCKFFVGCLVVIYFL